MPSDLRPPLEPFLETLGVPATVTRPVPDNTPVSTAGIWVQPLLEELPVGQVLQRAEPRRVLVLPKAALPTLPMGTLIVAPLEISQTARLWRVEGLERTDYDEWRAIVLAS